MEKQNDQKEQSEASATCGSKSAVERLVSPQIEYRSKTMDRLGRCHFFLNWSDGERNRSQAFFADPNQYGHKRPEE
jgi:hypothetical protein